MFKKVLSAVIVAVMLITVTAGCGIKDFPVSVGGSEISAPPERVVCFSAAVASAITALGFEEKIVGAPTEYLKENLNGAETNIKDIGLAMMPDWSVIYDLKPDVVVSYSGFRKDVANALALRNIKHVVIENPQSYGDVAGYYEELAKMFLGAKTGKETANKYNGEVAAALEKVKESNKNQNKKVAIFIEEGFLVTGDTLVGQVMEQVGINNIALNETEYMMSAVDIVAANPDIIFCPKGMSEGILNDELYKETSAVKSGSVYEINTSDLLFAGQDFCATLEAIVHYINQDK